MNTEKSVAISFRVTPKLKRMLDAAAEHERRSLTNMLEVLVEDFCAKHGIVEERNNALIMRSRSGKKNA